MVPIQNTLSYPDNIQDSLSMPAPARMRVNRKSGLVAHLLQPSSVGLIVNPLTLSFSDHQADLENPFLQGYFAANLRHLRICHIIAIFFYGLTGILEDAVIPDAKAALWLVRYGIVIPWFAAGLIFSFSAYYRKYWQIISVSYILATGGGFVAMIILGPKPQIYSYYVGIIVSLFFGYTFIRERFIYASIAGCVLFISYLGVSVYVVDTPFDLLAHNSMYLGIANFLGMMICYFMEYSARRDFLLVHLYQKEREKVKAANLELERRVEERTADIVKAHRRLQEEMDAHLRAQREKHELEAQLQRAQKMESLGTLAGGVAHDLNNILSGVVSYPDLLLSEIPEDNPFRSALLTIKKSGEKAAAIVQDLLTLARRGVAVSKVVHINSIVEEYLKSAEFQKLKGYHPNVTIDVELPEDLPNVLGSPVHLSKTIMNLVSNAAEAMPDGGTLTIRTGRRETQEPLKGYMTIESGRYVFVEVSDQGTGIAPQDLERIFEPFYSKKVMGRSGTGLGMAVVWGTVHDHKGYIDIKSALGKGTTFILYFPSTDQAISTQEQAVSLDMYKGSGESIVVVDDVNEQREIAAKILIKLGYRVTTFASGTDAVEYMQHHSADLLILDMIMDPGIDGLETYRRIVERHPRQKAIIASGFSETARVEELQQLGGGEYVRKPYSLETIGLTVKKALTT
jgi:signal transduction histidine kinase